jgi:prepilin-type N-terminal cleavage/methylation domain-containing protein
MLKKGFTLIELLVVIAIIAIITGIGIANLITAQKQARDAARREIISNVQNAFEQYYAEFNAYPASGAQGTAFEGGTAPSDPKGTANPLTWNMSTAAYCVCATLETGVGNAGVSATTTCNWAGTTQYCAQNKQ